MKPTTMLLFMISRKCDDYKAMAPKTVNGTQNLFSKSFVTHFSDQPRVITVLRYSSRRSQQRVPWCKHDRIWTYLRPHLHEFDEFEETVNEANVAHDIKSKLCNGDKDSCGRCRSQCSRTLVRVPVFTHMVISMVTF